MSRIYAICSVLFLAATASAGCTVTTTTDSCSADNNVAGCTGGSAGFSCTGNVTPDQQDSSLVCSDGIISGSLTEYCCLSTQYVFSASTCAVDNSVDCSNNPPPVQGFSCAGSDTPDQSDPNLVCSQDLGNGLFCCTF